MSITLPTKKVTFLYWSDVMSCLKEKYNEKIAEAVEDGWWEWSSGSDSFFYAGIEIESDDNSWFYLLAKCLTDEGINLDEEEVFIYAD